MLKQTNTTIYLFLDANYLDIVNNILQISDLATIIIKNDNKVKKGLKRVVSNSLLITDANLVAQYYANFKFKDIICLIPQKIKIKHNIKNITFYELPIIHAELRLLIESKLI